MKSEVKTKWINALKSGNYQQCTGTIYDKGKHCAYGVLCDIYAKEKGVRLSNILMRTPSNSLIPRSVAKWAGIDGVNHDPVVRMNDLLRNGFDEIAEYIKENIKGE